MQRLPRRRCGAPLPTGGPWKVILPGVTLVMLAPDCFYHSWMLGKQKDVRKFCGPKVVLLHHLRCWAKHAPAPRPLVVSFAEWWDCTDTGNISLDGSGQLCVTWSASRGWSVTIGVCTRYLSLGTEVFAFYVFMIEIVFSPCFFHVLLFYSVWVLIFSRKGFLQRIGVRYAWIFEFLFPYVSFSEPISVEVKNMKWLHATIPRVGLNMRLKKKCWNWSIYIYIYIKSLIYTIFSFLQG